jgi:hypothetical protein
MSTRLKSPRLCSVIITHKTGRIINKMLGVAFTATDRQKLYDKYKQYAHWCSGWNDSTLSKVEFKSEAV